jgi:hypothetical protein
LESANAPTKLVTAFDDAGRAFIDETVTSFSGGRDVRLSRTRADIEAPPRRPPEVLPFGTTVGRDASCNYTLVYCGVARTGCPRDGNRSPARGNFDRLRCQSRRCFLDSKLIGSAMTFDSIEFDPSHSSYIVRRGKRRWDVPLDLIRNVRDPEYLRAVNTAAERAWKEGRVTEDNGSAGNRSGRQLRAGYLCAA